MKNYLSKYIDYSANPIRSGMLSGVGLAIKAILIASAIGAFLVLLEKSTDGVGGAGGIIGFFVLPLFAVASAPWSFYIVKYGDDDIFIFGIVAGLLINGILLGSAYGVYRAIKEKNKTI